MMIFCSKIGPSQFSFDYALQNIFYFILDGTCSHTKQKLTHHKELTMHTNQNNISNNFVDFFLEYHAEDSKYNFIL